MGNGIASQYCQPEITICKECMHRDVCGDRDYLTENNCFDFWGWVSVNERLPEDGERVIVCATIIVGDSVTHSTVSRGIETTKFVSGKDGHYFCTLANWRVTHWMPLPEPPTHDTPGELGGEKGGEDVEG